METSWENSNQSYEGEFILVGVGDRPRLEMLLFGLILAFYLITLFSNTSIILVSILDPGLHTPMYFFLSNLSFLDICFGTSIGPQILVNFWRARKTIAYGGCVAQLFITLGLGSVECILLSVMAYDRYTAIIHPLRYPTIMSHSVCLIIAAVSWISGFSHSLLHTLLSFSLPRCGQNRVDHLFCELPSVIKLACVDTSLNEAVVLSAGSLFLLVPVTFITLSYGCIAAAVLRMRSAESRKRAFNTCSSHLMVVWLFFASSILNFMYPRSASSSVEVKLIPIVYIFVTTMLNPLIYSLRNKEVHKALQKLIKKK